MVHARRACAIPLRPENEDTACDLLDLFQDGAGDRPHAAEHFERARGHLDALAQGRAAVSVRNHGIRRQMDDGADGDGADEEWRVRGQRDRQCDQIRQFIGSMDGFGRVNVERADRADVFFRPRAGRGLLIGCKEEVRPWPVKINERAGKSSAGISLCLFRMRRFLPNRLYKRRADVDVITYALTIV